VEIGQFLRARPRTTALALLFPLVAGLVALAVLMAQPARYTATATVSVPSSSSDSASRVGLFVANFSEIALSPSVLREVARSTGESTAELEDRLEVARLGLSGLFDVTYTGEREEAVEPVVRAVITTTFDRLVVVTGADAALETATQAVAAAQAERVAYQDEIGTLQPESDYADLSSRIRSLEIDPGVTFVERSARRAALDRLNADRGRLVPQIRRMQELDQAVEAAAAQRQEAEQEVASVRQDASETQSPTTIRELIVMEESRVGRVIQGVGVAVVAGLLVGIAVLVLPDLLRRRREAAAEVPGDATPSRPTLATGVRDAS
jgi:hypothetical protein